VHCIKFLVEGLGITSDVSTASFVCTIKGRAVFDGLAEHFESFTVEDNVDKHAVMVFLFRKHNQLSLKLGDGKCHVRARNGEHDK